MYKVLDDRWYRSVWQCCDCGDMVEVTLWDYQNIGSPYCTECDQDMGYLQTRCYDKLEDIKNG